MTDTFEEWLSRTQVQRDALFAYAKTETPTDPVLISGDIDKAMRAEFAAGIQLVDCDYFLTGETAKAVMAYKEDEKSAKERDILVKDSVKGIRRLRDSLSLLKDILIARRIAGFGARKGFL